MKKLGLILIILMFVPIAVIAAGSTPKATKSTSKAKTHNETFVLGKDFRMVNSTKIDPHLTAMLEPEKNGDVVVTEFFSYGCPWCYRLESSLEAWLKRKPKYVKFQRVPVIFHKNWLIFAKAFYVAKAIGETDKMNHALFTAIQKNKKLIKTEGDLARIFEKEGVSKDKFTNYYNFSPEIDREMGKANALMRAYKVFQVPTLFVNDQYKAHLGFTNGDPQKLVKVMEYLVKKAHKGEKIPLPERSSVTIKKSAKPAKK